VYNVFAKFSTNESVNKIISMSCGLVVFVTGVFISLGILKLDKTVTSLLAGAGIIGLALSFAFQDLAVNCVSGLMIAFKKPISIGDLIETNGIFGTVTNIELRAVNIRNQQGQNIIIPCREILQKPVINYTTNGERRVDLRVAVSYKEDLHNVKAVLLSALSQNELRDTQKEVEIYFEEFAESSIVMSCRFWLAYNTHPQFLEARSRAIILIHKAFSENNITIPFPIRTIEFQSLKENELHILTNGSKGGYKNIKEKNLTQNT
jgi:small conductance mechanosensitive channel